MDDVQIRTTLLTLIGTLVACWLTYRASIRATRIQQQQADSVRSRQLREDLRAAEDEVAKLRRQVAVLTREAEQAAADLMYLRRTIWRPGMTVARLRELVGPEEPPSPNGQPGPRNT